MPYNVMIIDDDLKKDQPNLHRALDGSEFSIVAEGSHAKDVEPLEEKHHPDILVLNIQMRRVALDMIKKILQVHPNQLIVVSAESDDDDYIEQAFKMGAAGYFVQEYMAISLQTILKNVILHKIKK